MKKTLIMLWMAVSLMVVSFAGCTSEEMDYENPNVSLFVKQLKAQYELQCEKDNTDDKKELLEAKRRMMDLDDLI